jgi:hypothetical protein
MGAKGVISMELTIGSKTLTTTFFVAECWGDTRKIRITTQTRVEFSTRSSTQLGRKETAMLSASSTSPKKV